MHGQLSGPFISMIRWLFLDPFSREYGLGSSFPTLGTVTLIYS